MTWKIRCIIKNVEFNVSKSEEFLITRARYVKDTGEIQEWEYIIIANEIPKNAFEDEIYAKLDELNASDSTVNHAEYLDKTWGI